MIYSEVVKIQERVCRRLNVSREQLHMRSNEHRYVVPRQIAMWILRNTDPLRYSYPEIGHLFGYHHTTVMYAVQKVETARQSDPKLQAILSDIQAAQ